MTATYLSERTISDEVEYETSANLVIVILSYSAMFVYICLALGKVPHPVYSRFSLSFAGIIGVLLSVTIGLAMCAIVGYKVTLIVTDVLPFLILAIGADSLFLIVKDFDVQPSTKDTIEERITERLQLTFAEVAPSITSAVICEMCAFLLGLSTGISALKVFCISATVSLVANYFLIFTFFTGCLVLDARRQENFLIDIFCCFKARDSYSKIRLSKPSNIQDNQDTNLIIIERLQATNEIEDGNTSE